MASEAAPRPITTTRPPKGPRTCWWRGGLRLVRAGTLRAAADPPDAGKRTPRTLELLSAVHGLLEYGGDAATCPARTALVSLYPPVSERFIKKRCLGCTKWSRRWLW